jgi:hypothetical protein
MMPGREARAAIAGLLAFAGLLALFVRALEFDAPPSASFSVARKFWRADTRTRLLNSRLFQRDVELGVALLARDRAWPLADAVVLVLPESLAPEAAEEKRRKAAFVLAPREVHLERGETGPNGFQLRLARPAP